MAKQDSTTCKECKTNAVLAPRGKRKFKECGECREKRIRHLIHTRKLYRDLRGREGLLVRYYHCGSRYGYLVQLRRNSAILQPIGTMGGKAPDELVLAIDDVSGEPVQSKSTLADFLASKKAVVAKMTPVEPKPKLPPALSGLFGIVKTVTGLDADTIIDAAIHPEKQPELMRQVSINAARDAGRDIVQEAVQRSKSSFDAVTAIAMYGAGKRISEIVEATRGERAAGHTGNLVRKALRDAGVYREPGKSESPTTNAGGA